MSHIRLTRAHGRHALRAGGFGGFQGGTTTTGTESTSNTNNGDSGLDSILSEFGITGLGDETKTKAATTATSTSTLITSVSSTADPLTVSSSTPLSSSTTAISSTTTTTTTSSSSTSPTTTSTTTHTPIPITTTASGTALHNDITVTHVNSVTEAAAVAQTSSAAAPTTSNALVAPVIGGVAGGIVGLAVLVFLITWLLVPPPPTRPRRHQLRSRGLPPLGDAHAGPPDAPGHGRPWIQPRQPAAHGGAPPGPHPGQLRQRRWRQLAHLGQPARVPGTVLPPLPPGPNVSSPVSAYDHHTWGPVSGAAPVLTRNTSGSSAHSAHSTAGAPQYTAYPVLPAQPLRRNSTTRNGQLAPPQESEYLNLERTTSVTPFQAEQYVEISKQLNTDVPRGLDTPTVSQIVAEKMDLPPLPEPAQEDPFADAAPAEEEQELELEPTTLAKVQDMSFPAPPSPALSSSSRYARERVESMPPTLPEIVVQPRVSVTSAYLSDPGTPAAGQTVFVGAQLGKGPYAESPVGASRFPVTPSPLASSFSVPSPPAVATSFPEPVAQSEARKNRDTMYSTIYDPEDAYGGM
ncbi:hypothetical protein MSAN_00731000 [Mycena sanguinolenta]|uniref:Uncharacterized protein n=1 Tax=Mycena sanguinolenta TaxID=230812 RepID=A0A8H6Z5K7_9AGAR|nr:hypothetical protein MSAN_00731000 [Mycena sanguinolenta]